MVAGPGEPFTLWRLSLLSLLQLLCTISPVLHPASAVQSGFQTLCKRPRPGLCNLSDDIFICFSCGWWWTAESRLWFANATQNRPEIGRRWNWLQSRRVKKGMKILIWEHLLLLKSIPACLMGMTPNLLHNETCVLVKSYTSASYMT